MADLNEDIRDQLFRMLDHAQQRLNTLREVVSGANDDFSSSDLRIAIGDAITPLNLAAEIAEPLE